MGSRAGERAIRRFAGLQLRGEGGAQGRKAAASPSSRSLCSCPLLILSVVCPVWFVFPLLSSFLFVSCVRLCVCFCVGVVCPSATGPLPVPVPRRRAALLAPTPTAHTHTHTQIANCTLRKRDNRRGERKQGDAALCLRRFLLCVSPGVASARRRSCSGAEGRPARRRQSRTQQHDKEAVQAEQTAKTEGA